MPLKIVQIIPKLDAGGAERTLVDVSHAVIEAGGEALAITAGGRLEREVIAAGGVIAHLPVDSKNPYVMWRNAGRIAALSSAFGADLIHARSRAPAWSTRAACKQTGVPFVTTYHGTYNANNALKRGYNAIMAKGDRVIANSYFIGQHIKAEHGIDEARLAIIARGVDPAFFLVPEKPISDKINILLPGRLTRWKGQESAIKAMALLRQDFPDIRLILAGDAQGRDEYVNLLKAQVTAAKLDDQVHFYGHVEDMAALYTKADIVLSASIEPEAFGRVAVEGQASARLTLASAHGGTLETVLDTKTGFYFQPGQANDLARQLRKLLTMDYHAREQICRNARQHARLHYSRKTMCAKTLQVYQDIIHPRKGV